MTTRLLTGLALAAFTTIGCAKVLGFEDGTLIEETGAGGNSSSLLHTGGTQTSAVATMGAGNSSNNTVIATGGLDNQAGASAIGGAATITLTGGTNALGGTEAARSGLGGTSWASGGASSMAQFATGGTLSTAEIIGIGGTSSTVQFIGIGGTSGMVVSALGGLSSTLNDASGGIESTGGGLATGGVWAIGGDASGGVPSTGGVWAIGGDASGGTVAVPQSVETSAVAGAAGSVSTNSQSIAAGGASGGVTGAGGASTLASGGTATGGATGATEPPTPRVAFLADLHKKDVQELYVADINTTGAVTPRKLNSPVANSITSFEWSPQGASLAFLVDTSLYSVSTAAGQVPYKVTDDAAASYIWRDNGAGLAYANASRSTVYSVDLSQDPSVWTPTSHPWPSEVSAAGLSRQVLSLVPGPRGESFVTVLSLSDSSFASVYYSSAFNGLILTTGGALFPKVNYSQSPTLLAVQQPATMQLLMQELPPRAMKAVSGGCSWSPLGTLASELPNVGIFLYSRYYLHGGGWNSTKVTASIRDMPGPWSPDGRTLLYYRDGTLRVISLSPYLEVLYDVPLADYCPATEGAFGWSPDSQWVAALSDPTRSAFFYLALIRVSANPETSPTPYVSMAPPGVSAWRFSPDSSMIAYVGPLNGASQTELYVSRLPSTGPAGNAVRVSDPADGAVLDDINWLPAANIIVYRTKLANATQLRAVDLSQTTLRRFQISGLPLGTGVTSYKLEPTQN